MRSGNRNYHAESYSLGFYPRFLDTFKHQTDEQSERAIKHAEAKRKARRMRNLLRSWNGSLHNFSGVR